MGGKMSKNKGSRYELHVAKLFSTVYPNLKRTPQSGGMDFKGDIISLGDFPWHIECKKQEALNIWKALKQAREEDKDAQKIPIVVFSRNNEKDYVAIEAGDFINLLLELKELKEGE